MAATRKKCGKSIMTRNEILASANINLDSNPVVFKSQFSNYSSAASVNDYIANYHAENVGETIIDGIPSTFNKSYIKIIDDKAALWDFVSRYANGEKWVYAVCMYNIAGSELNIVIPSPTDEFKHLAIQCFACANGLPEATLREKTNVSMTNKHIWITVESDDGRIWKRERGIITDADYINRPFMQRISVKGKQWVANLINGKACELGDDITTRDERKARKAIGDKISMLRMKKGMTVKQLAEAANITPSNLSRIENYRYSPGLDVLARICDALGAELKIE